MKTYHVTIRACVTKTLEIHASDENEAEEIAHQEFNILKDAYDELYEQDTVACELQQGGDEDG